MARRLFVSSELVPVYEFDPSTQPEGTEPPSVVYIRTKMDMATQAAVTNDLIKIDDDRKVGMDIGANTLILLIHNIKRWSGPLFLDEDGQVIPCDAEHIRMLDPFDPFVIKVAQEINDRNKRPKSPNANGADAAGSVSSGSLGSVLPIVAEADEASANQ